MEPLRFSHLKLMAQSPAHYRYQVDHQGESASTVSQKRGSALHAMLLGEPWVLYDGIRRGKNWEAFQEEHPDELIVIGSEFDAAERMATAVRANRRAMHLLDGIREETITWRNMGRECAGTPDVRNPARVVELKSCRSSHPERFQRDALRYAYHAQLAWYLDGVRLSGLGTPQEAYIVAVESSAPCPVTVLRLTDRTLEQGRRLCRLWFERLMVCEQADEWPGYTQATVDFDTEDDVPLIIDGEEFAA